MHRFLVVIPMLVLWSCAHNQKQEVAQVSPQPTPEAVTAPPSPSQGAAAGEKRCGNDLDCADKQLCIRSRCVDISPDLAECQTIRVHFDFEAAEIKQDDQTGLQRMARCLKADHALHVSIQGNADERGTQEYNLSLGDRRATAVAKYLERLGVSDTQLKTVSYGKENPLCVDHDETCWAQNRRAAVNPTEALKKKKGGK